MMDMAWSPIEADGESQGFPQFPAAKNRYDFYGRFSSEAIQNTGARETWVVHPRINTGVSTCIMSFAGETGWNIVVGYLPMMESMDTEMLGPSCLHAQWG